MTAIAEPAAVVDPAGRRHALRLSPAGHVALFARALHLHQPGEVRRRAGKAALVEAITVVRDQEGAVHPRRSGHPGNFPACGNVAALQAIAATARQAGRECWCSPLARTAPVPGGGSVPGGRLVWADADTPDAVGRARELAATIPLRLVVESGGAADPDERRLHLYALADRWLAPTSSKRPTPPWPSAWDPTASGTADGSCACPAPATSRAGGPDAGAGSSPRTGTTPASPSHGSPA